MWNSLWNIYDGGATASEADISAQRTAAVRSNVRGSGGRNINGAGYNVEFDNTNNNTNNLQTSLHSTASTSNSSGSSRYHTQQPMVKSSAVGNTTVLRGLIVGDCQSGKSALVKRLRGDPFVDDREDGTNGTSHSNTKANKPKRNVMALIPWKIPEEAHHTKHNTTEIDELVQLYISEGKSFNYSEKDNRSLQKQWISALQSQHRGKKCNFVVWMVDPRNNNVLEFFHEGLKVLFPATGYIDCEDTEYANDKAKQQPLIQHLCILINFRDVQSTQKEDNKESLVDQMQQITQQVLDDHTNGDDVTPAPTILIYESSMKNCYGLQNLHSFITLPYLSHKERELIRRVEHTRRQQLQCKKGLKESKVIQYDDFVEHIIVEKDQKQHTKPLSDRQKLEEEKKRLQRRLKEQNEVLLQSREKQDDGRDSTKTAPLDVHLSKESRAVSTQSSDRKVQRHVLPVAGKSVPTTAITEQTNLESFFSDDEEDGDQSQSDTDSSSSDDSSDDDDDFIVDVSGTRLSHVNTSRRKKPELAKQTDPNRDIEGSNVKAEGELEQIIVKDEYTSDTVKIKEEDDIKDFDDIKDNNTKPENENSDVVLEKGEVKEAISADKDDTDCKDDIKHDTNSEIDDDIEEVVEESRSKEVNIDNTKRDNAEDSVCDDSVKKDDTSLEVDTADTATSSDKDPEDTPSEVESENQQRQLVIDSDDEESTGMIEHPIENRNYVRRKDEPPASLKQPEISNSTPAKTTQVSSKALAAIEEARKEAELMIASPTKKSKSKKKKKSKKKDKKKN